MNVEVPMSVVWGMIGYILVTTGLSIWWAATTTEQLKTLKEMFNNLQNTNGLYARKEDVLRELGVIERNIETMFVKYDKLKEKVDGGGK